MLRWLEQPSSSQAPALQKGRFCSSSPLGVPKPGSKRTCSREVPSTTALYLCRHFAAYMRLSPAIIGPAHGAVVAYVDEKSAHVATYLITGQRQRFRQSNMKILRRSNRFVAVRDGMAIANSSPPRRPAICPSNMKLFADAANAVST